MRRDLPNRSSVGGLFVNRQATGELAGQDDFNRTFGFDGRWGFGQNGIVSGFAARTETPGRVGEEHAYDVAVDYNAQAWRVRAGYMEMGDNFNPEVGFVRRRGFRRVDGGIFYTWRPDAFLKMQELRPHVTFNRFWNYDRGFIESSLVHMDNFWSSRTARWRLPPGTCGRRPWSGPSRSRGCRCCRGRTTGTRRPSAIPRIGPRP